MSMLSGSEKSGVAWTHARFEKHVVKHIISQHCAMEETQLQSDLPLVKAKPSFSPTCVLLKRVPMLAFRVVWFGQSGSVRIGKCRVRIGDTSEILQTGQEDVKEL